VSGDGIAGDAAEACADALFMACAALLTRLSSTGGGKPPTVAQVRDLALVMLEGAAYRAICRKRDTGS
jgi:hypothetical protein